MESALIAGSPFAQYLISALRGGADADGNGSASIGEIYAYVHARTTAATLDARTGPEHPSGLFDLNGAGEFMVAENRRDAIAIRRRRGGRTPCYVTDEEEVRVLAEIPADQVLPVYLPSRPVLVKCPTLDAVQVARVARTAREVFIEDLDFASKTKLYALAKGPDGRPMRGISLAGGVLTSANAPADSALVLRYRDGTHTLGWNLQGMLGLGTNQDQVVITGGLGYLLPWFRVSALQVEIGIETGGGVDSGRVLHGLLLVGQFAEIDLPFADELALTSRADLLEAFVLAPRVSPNFAAIFSLGVRASWLPK